MRKLSLKKLVLDHLGQPTWEPNHSDHSDHWSVTKLEHSETFFSQFVKPWPSCQGWWWWQYDGNVDERGYVWGNWCRQKGFLHKRRNYQAFIPTFCCSSSSRWWSSSLKLRSQGIIWMGFKLIWIELLSTSDMRRYRQHHKHHLHRHQHHHQASKSAHWFHAPDKSVPVFLVWP